MSSYEDMYLEYAEFVNEISDLENEIRNRRRMVENLKKEIMDGDNDGGFAIDISSHAFKQISERLEILATESPIIYKDIFREEDPSKSLMMPSNLKSFLITILADARKKGLYALEPSKHSKGQEHRFTIDIKKWSDEKRLQFVGIVENYNLKTGFFNWV